MTGDRQIGVDQISAELTDDLLLLADDPRTGSEEPARSPWILLVVDDDAEVHAMTRMLLNGFEFDGRPVELLRAMSGAEGERILRSRDDIAMALIDVVMETDDAGLRLVRLVREELGDRRMCLVLRTGQPGSAPEEDVVVRYDINDYREKTELTVQKLITMVISGLRHYRALSEVERHRIGLERMLRLSAQLFDRRPPAEFAQEAANQLAMLVPQAHHIVLAGSDGPAFAAWSVPDGDFMIGAPDEADRTMSLQLDCRVHPRVLLTIQSTEPIDGADRRLLEIYCDKLAVGFDNAQLFADMVALNQGLESQVAVRTQELTEKSRMLEATLTGMSDGIAVFGADRRLRLANRRAYELLGLGRLATHAGWHYDELTAELARARAIVVKGTPDSDETDTVSPWDEIAFPDGRAVQVRRTDMPDGGHVYIFLDVSHDRRRERELQQARLEAELAAKARSEFLAVMSHEIRTPMNGIMGITQLALGLVRDPRIEDHLQTIRYSGETLLAILNDILDFSKIEAGGLRFEALPFDLRRTIDGVISLMSSRAAEKGLALSASIADDLPNLLIGDAGRLRQVLLNLVGNALKFTPAGAVAIQLSGAVVEAGRVRIAFAVEDTGIGIDSGSMGRLFQSYSQADETIARRFGGTGLGLAICKRIVDLQGGAIGVSSSPGKGSRFWFHLEFAVDEGQAIPASTPSLPSQQSLSILLVEDNALNQRVGVGLLEKAGHRVMVAEHGLRAIELLTGGHRFDLVLMDLHMPVMDGIAATHAIRALSAPLNAIPVIALTAAATSTDLELATAAGMSGFVSKPLELARLKAAIAETLDRRTETIGPLANGESFDPSQVRTILASLGGTQLEQLIERFFGSAESFVAEIAEAADRDQARAAFLAHSFTGSASILGCMDLARTGQRIELACRAGRVGEVRDEIRQLPELFRRARTQVLEATP